MTFKDKTFELVDKNEVVFNDLIKYVELIEEKNKFFNLTGFSGDTLWQEGIYQSIILMKESFNETRNKKMLDIGSGAGFPSIPFLILKRDFSLFIAEPNKKRINFLQIVNNELSLNISFINERIEDYNKNELFDLVTARAVMSLKKLIEISSKVGKINAEYSFLKGPKVHEELIDSEWIINKLSIQIDIKKVDIIENISSQKVHYLCKYNKIKATPLGFPRPWLLIK
ncbi:MAG: 16S rRNA (guanine(527)-N(7))-methyltransferase RsmG [Metamycoplasmataceae bacterium]